MRMRYHQNSKISVFLVLLIHLGYGYGQMDVIKDFMRGISRQIYANSNESQTSDHKQPDNHEIQSTPHLRSLRARGYGGHTVERGLKLAVDPDKAVVQIAIDRPKKVTTHCIETKKYISSSTELRWVEKIDHFADNTREWKVGCEEVRKDSDLIVKYLNYWKEREEIWTKSKDLGYTFAKANEFPKDILSYFEITETCDNEPVKTSMVPIEPLMGFLRHPLHHCIEKSSTYYVNKDYMLPVFAHEIDPMKNNDQFVARNFFFDLGASLYNTGAGGASQQWFVDTYRARGIEFDHILAWEITTHSDREIFDAIPADIIGKVSYYNIPADIGLAEKHNPIRILMDVTKPGDFVAIKIDIDESTLELAFIRQILGNSEISNRIDELYFEHHVSKNPMVFQGWGEGSKFEMNITESYDIFLSLRQRGIRAHSWV